MVILVLTLTSSPIKVPSITAFEKADMMWKVLGFMKPVTGIDRPMVASEIFEPCIPAN